MFARLGLTAIVGLALSACATAPTTILTTAELRDLVTGNSFAYSGNLQGKRFSGKMEFHENGNLFVSTDSGIPEGGTWRLKPNEVCTRLVALRNGEENCFSISRLDNGGYRTSHGFAIEQIEEASK